MSVSLPKISLFSGLTDEELTRLPDCLPCAVRQYKKGATILAEGDRTQEAGVVLSGRVLIGQNDAWGNHTVIGTAGVGDIFAEAYACLPQERLTVCVTAAEDSRVLFLRLSALLTPEAAACPLRGRLLVNLLTLCAGKNLRLTRRIQHTSPKTIRGRLLSYLSECRTRAGADSFSLPFDRQQLADHLGVDRSALSKELSKMPREGLLQFRRNRFTLSGSAQLPDTSARPFSTEKPADRRKLNRKR